MLPINPKISVQNFMGSDYVVEKYVVGNTTHKKCYKVEYDQYLFVLQRNRKVQTGKSRIMPETCVRESVHITILIKQKLSKLC